MDELCRVCADETISERPGGDSKGYGSALRDDY